MPLAVVRACAGGTFSVVHVGRDEAVRNEGPKREFSTCRSAKHGRAPGRSLVLVECLADKVIGDDARLGRFGFFVGEFLHVFVLWASREVRRLTTIVGARSFGSYSCDGKQDPAASKARVAPAVAQRRSLGIHLDCGGQDLAAIPLMASGGELRD